MSFNKITMWSWLTKHEVKSEIYCPPDLQVGIEEFANELKAQAEADRVPAQIELCEVNWDDTNTKQNRIIVRHTGGGASTDALQFLVGVDQMGNYTYVEEKIFIMPPNLPKVPDLKKKEKTNPTWFVVIALFFLLIGMGEHPKPSLIAIGAIVGFIAIMMINSNKNIEAHNKQAEEEKNNWDEAWEDWRRAKVEIAYLSSTDDVFGRFTLAVSSTVKQVIKKLFEDRKAEVRKREEKSRDQKQMEEETEKRKQAFK